MNVDEIKAEYLSALSTTGFAEHSRFLAHLRERDDSEILAFHFDALLNGENPHLRDRLRAAFVKRGPGVKDFLLRRIESAGDDATIAECIQILGHLRIDEVRPVALACLSHSNAEIRYRAIIVLGWVGHAEDINALGDRFDKESEARLRGFIATALRQIYLRLPDVRDAALLKLATGIQEETSPDALRLMIASAQTITQRKFGVKESINNGTVSGDEVKARTRFLDYMYGLEAP